MNPQLFSPQMAIFALFWASVIGLGYWSARRAKKWREDLERALQEQGFESEPAPPDVAARFAPGLEDTMARFPPPRIFRRRDLLGDLLVGEWQLRYPRSRRRGRLSREWLFALQLPAAALPHLTVDTLPANGFGSLLGKLAALGERPGRTKTEWAEKPTNAVVFAQDGAAAQNTLRPAVFDALAGLGWATLHTYGSTAVVNSNTFNMTRDSARVDRAKLTALLTGLARLAAALKPS